MFNWKDTTSRSQGETAGSEPRTVTATLAWARVSVTRHIHYPGKWMLLANDLGISQHQPLKAVALAEAKAEAEMIVCRRIAELAAAVGVAP